MEPRIAAIMRARYWMTSILRVVVLIMIVWGALQFTGTIIRVLPDIQYMSILQAAVLSWPLRWIALAFILIATEQRLLRWLFPLPRQGCPQCNYPIAGRRFDTCPECGLVLQSAGGEPPSTSIVPPGYQQ